MLVSGHDDTLAVQVGCTLAASRGQDRDPDAAATCGLCHKAIYEEWKGRAHNLAWVDPIYQDALKQRKQPERCHGCHAPASVQARLGKRPNARTERRQEGVTCVSCHKDGDRIAGPFDSQTDAHPSVKHPAFTEQGAVSLCASCHDTRIGPVLPLARDFLASGLAERGKSCIGCHMPEMERHIAISFITGKPVGEKRRGRRHTVVGPSDPEFCKTAFEVGARRDGRHVVLSITNRAGHRVPGLTLRSFPFTLRMLDDAGKALAEHRVVISSENILKVTETREFRFALAEETASAEVVVEHAFQNQVTELTTERFPL